MADLARIPETSFRGAPVVGMGSELLKPAATEVLQKWPGSRWVNGSRASDREKTAPRWDLLLLSIRLRICSLEMIARAVGPAPSDVEIDRPLMLARSIRFSRHVVV